MNYVQNFIVILNCILDISRVGIHDFNHQLLVFIAKPHQENLMGPIQTLSYIKSYWLSNGVFETNSRSDNGNIIEIRIGRVIILTLNTIAPPIIPKPRGKPVMVTYFLDEDHNTHQVYHHSYSARILYVNCTLKTWYCKQQNVIEASTFDLDIVFARNAKNSNENLTYKLSIFGINT